MFEGQQELLGEVSGAVDSVARTVREVEVILGQSSAGRSHVEIVQSPDNRLGESLHFEPKIAAMAL